MPSRNEYVVLSKKLSLPETKIEKWLASERHRNKKKDSIMRDLSNLNQLIISKFWAIFFLF